MMYNNHITLVCVRKSREKYARTRGKRRGKSEEIFRRYNDTSRERKRRQCAAHIQARRGLCVCTIAAVHTAATGNAVKIGVREETNHI